MYLTRENILARRGELPREEVEVFDGKVYVRTLSAGERTQYEKQFVGPDGKNNFQAARHVRSHLVALAVVDEKGERIFSDADVDAINELSALEVEKIFNTACRLSGLSKKDVEDLEKNSETTPSDSPASA